jgi:hypothetical protein
MEGGSGSRIDSIQHFLFTFFRDQLLEQRHDLVPPCHHGFYLIFVEIMIGLLGQLVGIKSLQFLEQLTVAAFQVAGVSQVLRG